MVPHRVRTQDGNAAPRRMKPCNQARVTGSEGYPEPTGPSRAMAWSRCCLATMLAAPHTGKLASALGSTMRLGTGQSASTRRRASRILKAGIPRGLHGASMITASGVVWAIKIAKASSSNVLMLPASICAGVIAWSRAVPRSSKALRTRARRAGLSRLESSAPAARSRGSSSPSARKPPTTRGPKTHPRPASSKPKIFMVAE